MSQHDEPQPDPVADEVDYVIVVPAGKTYRAIESEHTDRVLAINGDAVRFTFEPPDFVKRPSAGDLATWMGRIPVRVESDPRVATGLC